MADQQSVVYLGPEQVLNTNSELRVTTPAPSANELPPTAADFHIQSSAIPRNHDSALDLQSHLTRLAELVANVTESYTTAIFLVDENATLQAVAVHTLSRDFVSDARIPIGSGLVGWTGQHGVRVSVCPFEHDATTLLYYTKEQDLKSFMALPIIDSNNRLLGVISCDSKRTYAFSKVTEKVMCDCAAQAATLVALHGLLDGAKLIGAPKEDDLTTELEKLRQFVDEDTLLSAVAELSPAIISRDALVVITSPMAGITNGSYYTGHGESRANHRLLETLCKHKKVLCADRSVLARPVDDIQKRSFLSVPFRMLGREAGSFNLLSKPGGSFHAAEIEALERIAEVVGKQVELIRLRNLHASAKETTNISSWKVFASQANALLQDAKKQRRSLALYRLALTDLSEIEELFGVEAATIAMQSLMRLVDQVKPQGSPACYLYGTNVLVLLDAAEAPTIIARLTRLVERISLAGTIGGPQPGTSDFGARIAERFVQSNARYPRDGETLATLIAKTLPGIQKTSKTTNQEQPFVFEEVAHAGSWK